MIHEFERAVIYTGDSLVLLAAMPENSIHACVTDPPYELGFMGKTWDRSGIAYRTDFWAQVLRVLKPGAHLLAFGGTRTHHRMVCAIEDAGFEIRDEIDWIFGSGFPKSSNQEGEWEGWGTALKPAKEPICLARKPLIGTVPKNLRVHGTGAINVDGCRVGDDEIKVCAKDHGGSPQSNLGNTGFSGCAESYHIGRWPANIIHDGSPEVLAAFPDAKGQLADASSSSSPRSSGFIYGAMTRGNGRDGELSADSDNEGAVGFNMKPGARRNDTGSAARFFKQCPFTDEDREFAEQMRIFYCAKASKADREEGCDALPEVVRGMSNGAKAAQARGEEYESSDNGMNKTVSRKNHHPTVKPEALMRYLCRLITPPGGTIIDPFMGSGSTGKAAVKEGFAFIGIEKDPAYMEIAKARIRAAHPMLEVDFA